MLSKQGSRYSEAYVVKFSQKLLFIAFSIIFIVNLALIFYYQTTLLIYIGSIWPLFIAFTFPNLRARQWIKLWNKGNTPQIYFIKGAENEEIKVALQFKPGTIYWGKQLLCLKIPDENLAIEQTARQIPGATIEVSSTDLVSIKKPKSSFAIQLQKLKKSITGHSFSHHEVTQFIIHLHHIKALSRKQR